MKPDQVIGLRAPSYIARSETHFPVEGRESVLLPFLVIEAKREKDAPGFRAILYQTAFPVRRFLRAQADIDSRDASSEPCLVWFFAYQGEHWKLHAGTLDGDKVVSFRLRYSDSAYVANVNRESTTSGKATYTHKTVHFSFCY